jgi:hypothetical protein
MRLQILFEGRAEYVRAWMRLQILFEGRAEY